MSSVLSRYAQSGLAGALQPGRSAVLIVVDMQNGFTDPACQAGFEMPDVVKDTARLVASAHDHGIPVVFTTIAFPAAAQPVWLSKMPAMQDLREGSHWSEIDAATGITDDDRIIVKQAASAFSGTDLATQLSELGADTVVVCGATTSGCIRATAVDAISIGLRPFVVDTAVGDREQAPHDAALVDIQAKYGEVVSMEQALTIFEEQR